MDKIKIYSAPLLLAITTIAFYSSFAYDLHRSDFIKLISLYSALFILSYLLIEKFKLNICFLFILGILSRLLFIGALPNLSQDFYRFIWDGRILKEGLSPYLFTPDTYVNISETFKPLIPQAELLYKGMGTLSAGNFSNYPPVNQIFFAAAAVFAGKSILGSVMVLRTFIILADIGIFLIGKKILKKLKLPRHNIFWYFLNPFIIIELTGNLHFEGVMLVFFVFALFLLFKGEWVWAAVLLGISISIKLIPLLFLPLFLTYFEKVKGIPKITDKTNISLQKLIYFYLIIGVTVILTFLPFISQEFLQNFSSTIALWFQNFEFNASLYYIIRWLGYKIVGWNIIGILGKILPLVVLFFVLALSFRRRNRDQHQLLEVMLFVISFYFFLSTTVHPWYIATPVLISIFTRYRFPILWSFMIILSYSAYGWQDFNENLWMVGLEYSIVIGYAIWEIFFIKEKPAQYNKT